MLITIFHRRHPTSQTLVPTALLPEKGTIDCGAVGHPGAPLAAQLVQNLPVMQETWVQSLGWEDPLEKGKATHSTILAWKILWTV